jgi:hypothetical protein
LPHLDGPVLEYVTSADFDGLLAETVRSTFPAHEHEHVVKPCGGLVGGSCPTACESVAAATSGAPVP